MMLFNHAAASGLPAIFFHFFSRQTLYSLAVFLLIFPLIRLAKKHSPRWHYCLWLLILIRLVIPPGFSQPYSLRNVILPITSAAPLLSSLSAPLSLYESDFPEAEEKGGRTGTGESAQKPFPLPVLFFVFWAGGSLYFLFRYAHGFGHFIRTARRAEILEGGKAVLLLSRWKRRLGIRRPIKIVCSEKCTSPFTIGFFRPVIHLPASLLQPDSTQLVESVIAHEAAHIRRKDALSLHFENLLRIVYFFNPLVWAAASRIQLARECLCDHMVLSYKTFSAETYGNSLLAVLRHQRPGPGAGGLVPGMGNQSRHLQIRFKHLKGEHTLKKHPMFLTTVIAAFLGLLLLPMAGQKTQTEKPEVKVKLERLNISLDPLPVLNVDPALATLEPILPGEIPHIQKSRKILTVRDKIRLNFKNELNAKVDLQIRTAITLFINPVPGAEVSSGFGERLHPRTKELMFHNGVDLAAATGTPVLAAGNGMVIKAIADSPDEAFGFYVIVAHKNGYETLYSSLNRVLVTEGEEIRQGDVIGHIGQTGQSVGPHLHFEIRKDGTPVDPGNFIEFQK